MMPTKKDKFASESINKAEYQRGRVQQARKNYLESQKKRKRRKEKEIANAPAATPPRQKSLKNKSKKDKHALELAPPFHTSFRDVEAQSTNDENGRKPGAFDVRPGGLVSAAGQVSSQSVLSESERRNGKDKISHENENENIISIPNATLVVEEEDFETRVKKIFQRAPVAEVVSPDSGSEEKRRLCTRKMMIFIAVLVLVLLIVAVVVPYVVLTQPKNPTPTAQPIPTLDVPFYPIVTDYDSITLYLKLGDSSNIGFDLACGDLADDVIERRKAPAFFSKPRSVATDVYHQVPVGRDCEVKVTNMDGTGLQPGGFLRIYQGVGQISDDALLLEMSGDFTNEKNEVFQVGISESNVPSLAPTIAPPTTPSTDAPSSTNAPALSPVSDSSPTYAYEPKPEPAPLPTDYVPWPSALFPPPPSFSTPPPTASPVAPTQAPITPPPTFASLSITVDILLDNFPIETGWNLTCGNDVKADFPAETYFAQNWNIVQKFSINYNEPCSFFIIDSAEDGVCCSNGRGRYRIDIVGDGSSTNLLSIDNIGDFGAASHEAFECTVDGCTIIT